MNLFVCFLLNLSICFFSFCSDLFVIYVMLQNKKCLFFQTEVTCGPAILKNYREFKVFK